MFSTIILTVNADRAKLLAYQQRLLAGSGTDRESILDAMPLACSRHDFDTIDAAADFLLSAATGVDEMNDLNIGMITHMLTAGIIDSEQPGEFGPADFVQSVFERCATTMIGTMAASGVYHDHGFLPLDRFIPAMVQEAATLADMSGEDF